MLDSGAEGPGFKSQPGNSLRQTVHTNRASVYQAAKMVAALLRVAGVTAGLAESNAAYRRVYDSRDLQAGCKEPGSAPEPYARQSCTGYLYLYMHGDTYQPIMCIVHYRKRDRPRETENQPLRSCVHWQCYEQQQTCALSRLIEAYDVRFE